MGGRGVRQYRSCYVEAGLAGSYSLVPARSGVKLRGKAEKQKWFLL